jgi:hypothetical protein
MKKNISSSKYFVDNVLLERLSKFFLSDKLPNQTKIVSKIKNLISIDENYIHLPTSQITDLINFSILTESEEKNNEILSNSEFRINKISELFNQETVSETEEVEENTYSEEQIIDFVKNLESSYNINISEKNGYQIISLNKQ